MVLESCKWIILGGFDWDISRPHTFSWLFVFVLFSSKELQGDLHSLKHLRTWGCNKTSTLSHLGSLADLKSSRSIACFSLTVFTVLFLFPWWFTLISTVLFLNAKWFQSVFWDCLCFQLVFIEEVVCLFASQYLSHSNTLEFWAQFSFCDQSQWLGLICLGNLCMLRD